MKALRPLVDGKRAGLVAGVLAVGLTLWLGSTAIPATAAPSASVRPGTVTAMRRLTEAQYRNAIADIFGPAVDTNGRYEAIQRPDQGLIATGARVSGVSPAGFEKHDVMARLVADQVLAPGARATFLPCTPKDPAKADPACARDFFEAVGPYVLRRPVTPAEVKAYADIAGRASAPAKDFYAGLSIGLATLLVSPEFLYRVEAAAPNGRELDPWSKAARLSFLLWNSIPDDILLEAAGRGELDTPQGLEAQVDRLLASPRLEQGVRAFFSDFLQLDRAREVSKDPLIYGRFNRLVAQDLPEQTLRTIVDHLLVSEKSYPELFTTRRTFVSRRLGLLYGVPAASDEGWSAFEFPPDDDRAGLLGQASFLALYSHEGRSSPTLRGKAIREVLLCQPVPPPPPNVDFSGFNDTSSKVLKTARQRLDSHNTDPVCASCHKITDPLGLPLEGFDGAGLPRTTENGAAIDTSGSFDGQAFDGAAAFGRLLANNPEPSACVARRLAEYATGVGDDRAARPWIARLTEAFGAGGHRFRPLLRSIALSPEFYAVANPKAQTAKLVARSPPRPGAARQETR